MHQLEYISNHITLYTCFFSFLDSTFWSSLSFFYLNSCVMWKIYSSWWIDFFIFLLFWLRISFLVVAVARSLGLSPYMRHHWPRVGGWPVGQFAYPVSGRVTHHPCRMGVLRLGWGDARHLGVGSSEAGLIGNQFNISLQVVYFK